MPEKSQIGPRPNAVAVFIWLVVCLPAAAMFVVSLGLTLFAIRDCNLKMPLASGFLIATSLFLAAVCQAVIKVRELQGHSVSSAWDNWRWQAIASTFPSAGVLMIGRCLEKQDVRGLFVGGFFLVLYMLFLFAPPKKE
jgi:hypothetical protein